MIHESIKPYEFCNAGEIDKCIDAFEKEITDKKYATIPFLYDGAKYFHRAFMYHADYKPESIDPYIFKRKYASSLFPNVRGNLRAYIDDYEYGLEHHPEDEMPPPFNMLWNEFNLAKCEEETLVFWVNRFIISVCHHLHGFDPNIEKIVSVFAGHTEEKHFSHLASYEEIAQNDYNLSVSTYVEAEDTREKIDIKKLNAEIDEIVAREATLRAEIDAIIKEIEG